MNVTPFLVIFLVSTCHGEEQDDSPAPGTLSATKWEKEVETHEEDTCPDAADIEPCECTKDYTLSMDCSKVVDEEQLRVVFSAVFPTTEFYRFTMYGNYGLKILEDDVFSNVTFRYLDIKESVLETVENDALTSSLSTLEYLVIQDCQLATFPFEKLAEFTSLRQVGFYSNNIHTLPPFSSTTLRVLSLGENLIEHLSADVFNLLWVVEEIYLNGNQLTEIPQGTFAGLPKLEYLRISDNNITYLPSLTFEVISSHATSGLFLENNNIDTVEVGTFDGVIGTVGIYMDNNALTRLPEEVWKSVLERGTRVQLGGNPLTCGCDVAWLVRDPQLLTTVVGAGCTDGTMLADLNPDDFDVCG